MNVHLLCSLWKALLAWIEGETIIITPISIKIHKHNMMITHDLVRPSPLPTAHHTTDKMLPLHWHVGLNALWGWAHWRKIRILTTIFIHFCILFLENLKSELYWCVLLCVAVCGCAMLQLVKWKIEENGMENIFFPFLFDICWICEKQFHVERKKFPQFFQQLILTAFQIIWFLFFLSFRLRYLSKYI